VITVLEEKKKRNASVHAGQTMKERFVIDKVNTWTEFIPKCNAIFTLFERTKASNIQQLGCPRDDP